MERAQHYLDANGKTLGRLATEAAVLLRGKNKIGFTYNQDLGDFVTINNCEKIRVTGKKATQKMYYRHSTYPGGLTEIRYDQMMIDHPERILELAIRNMLPDNRLRSNWMERLSVKVGPKIEKEAKSEEKKEETK